MRSQNFACDRIVVPKVSVLDILIRHLIFHWDLVSEYGEDRDKQISLHNRRVKGGERNKYTPVGAIITVPRLHSLWHTGSMDVTGCVCSRVPSVLTASASLDQLMMPDHHSACSHSQQTACNTLANTSVFTPKHQRTLVPYSQLISFITPSAVSQTCVERRYSRSRRHGLPLHFAYFLV
jgi:hypothetical protein